MTNSLDDRLDAELLRRLSDEEGKHLYGRIKHAIDRFAVSEDISHYAADRHVLLLYAKNTKHPHFPEILTSTNIGVKSFLVIERYLHERGLIKDRLYAEYLVEKERKRQPRRREKAADAG